MFHRNYSAWHLIHRGVMGFFASRPQAGARSYSGFGYSQMLQAPNL